jgi:hypothetical protein
LCPATEGEIEDECEDGFEDEEEEEEDNDDDEEDDEDVVLDAGELDKPTTIGTIEGAEMTLAFAFELVSELVSALDPFLAGEDLKWSSRMICSLFIPPIPTPLPLS